MIEHVTQWIDIEGGHSRGSRQSHLTLSGRRLHLSVGAIRQLRESASLSNGGPLSIRVRTNPEKTKLSITADPGGLRVQKSGHTSGHRLHTFLGEPAQPVRVDLEWDADETMFVGEIPPKRA